MKQLVLCAALACALAAPAAASADTTLDTLGNRAKAQSVTALNCAARGSAPCIDRALTNLLATHTAIFRRATTIIRNSPTSACIAASRTLYQKGQGTQRAITRWYVDEINATNIHTFGTAEIPFIKAVWYFSAAC